MKKREAVVDPHLEKLHAYNRHVHNNRIDQQAKRLFTDKKPTVVYQGIEVEPSKNGYRLYITISLGDGYIKRTVPLTGVYIHIDNPKKPSLKGIITKLHHLFNHTNFEDNYNVVLGRYRFNLEEFPRELIKVIIDKMKTPNSEVSNKWLGPLVDLQISQELFVEEQQIKTLKQSQIKGKLLNKNKRRQYTVPHFTEGTVPKEWEDEAAKPFNTAGVFVPPQIPRKRTPNVADVIKRLNKY